MELETIEYTKYEKYLPQQGNVLIGQQHNENIIVYQAFNDEIADYAIANQKFGGIYRFTRMTWIKPNFLWMMYRCGWATKENQNRVLAIEITIDGFLELMHEGVLSSYTDYYENQQDWKEQLVNSNIRIQWDPDHNNDGAKLDRKAIQIGLKGDALKKFNNTYIKSISDITLFVQQQQKNIINNEPFFVAKEKVIVVNDKEQLLKHSISFNTMLY